MIYVTCGHEQGIGLEVFLKSFLCLNESYQSQFILIINEEIFLDTLSFCSLNKIDFKNLDLIFLPQKDSDTFTTQSMLIALDRIQEKDILLTLPSSKDQFYLKNHQLNGHTEFFRAFFKESDIGMNFLTNDTNVLLLTDHISISDVESSISTEYIVEKVSKSLNSINTFRDIKEVFFSGINPHCGEDGLIGSSDKYIEEAIVMLRSLFPNINFKGMFPGDTLHFKMKNKKQLFVYAFHDQGLAPFKLKYGLKGINFTSGLPFKRVSVDHGTSFDLYKTNKANYFGMLYLLNEIENWT